MDVEDKSNLYDNYVSSGQSGVQTELSSKDIFESRRPYIEYLISNFLPKNKAVDILDLGCGAGAILYYLQKNGYTSYKGIDISSEQIKLGQSLGIQHLIHTDIVEYTKSQPEDSADVIFLLDVIEHIQLTTLIDFLKQVKRVLKEHGLLILHIPNAEGIFGSRIRYGDLTHELAFTPTSIHQLLNIVGFSNIKCLEDRPVGSSFKSRIRRIAWLFLTLYFRLLYLAESGMRKPILSQNMLVTCHK